MVGFLRLGGCVGEVVGGGLDGEYGGEGGGGLWVLVEVEAWGERIAWLVLLLLLLVGVLRVGV